MILFPLTAFFALFIATAFAVPAVADDEGPDGYGRQTTYELQVSHDGYPGEGDGAEAPDPTTYVVVESEEGTTEQVEGETVIVVQEPEPVAATQQAPPSPRTVVAEEQIPACSGGIWVDGYWYYSNGQYLWVDGHCVVERVNYVFVHPRWDFYWNIWWFVPGYYRPCGVFVGFGYYRPWHWYPPYFHPYYSGRRPVPVHRSVPRRPTTAHATPAPRSVGRVGSSPTRSLAVSRDPTQRPTVTYRAPAGATRAATIGRVGAGPTLMSTVPASRGMVSQPRVNLRRTGTIYRPSSTPSRGSSISRSRGSRSRGGSGWSPSSGSSGSSRGRSVGGTRSPSSRGSSGPSGRGSSAPSSGGSGRGSSGPSGRGR